MTQWDICSKIQSSFENAFRTDHANPPSIIASRRGLLCIVVGILIIDGGNMAESISQLLQEAAQALEWQTANVGPSENPSSGLSTTPSD